MVPFNSKCSPGISAMKYLQTIELFLGSIPNITSVNLKRFRENRCYVCSNLHVNLHILRVSQISTSWLKAPEAAPGTNQSCVYSPWPTVPWPEWPLEVTDLLYSCEHSKESTIVLFSVQCTAVAIYSPLQPWPQSSDVLSIGSQANLWHQTSTESQWLL